MKDFTPASNRLAVTLLSTALCACVVAPKKVANYDEKCKVSTQKIELTLEQADTFHELQCTNDHCELDFAGAIASSALIATTSAIISGSIALVGNTVYWVESQGECPNINRLEPSQPKVQHEKTDEKYIIKEEIITAKS